MVKENRKNSKKDLKQERVPIVKVIDSIDADMVRAQYFLERWIEKHVKSIFVLLKIFSLLYICWLCFWGCPFVDLIFIIFNVWILVFVVGQRIIDKSWKLNVEVLSALVLGMIALQAAWPVFMPRISLEDLNPVVGFYDEYKNDQVEREALIRVKPPLFPFPLLTNRLYPIANNLTSFVYRNSNANLDIGCETDESIRVTLKKVTGWSFDEVSAKIKYASDEDLIFNVRPKTISNVSRIKDYYAYRDFPYIYRSENITIKNGNDFPLRVSHLSFSICNDSVAWRSLKEWVDDGFCIFSFYSNDFHFRSRPILVSNVKDDCLYSIEDFNSSCLNLEISGMMYLHPNETELANIYFREVYCRDDRAN